MKIYAVRVDELVTTDVSVSLEISYHKTAEAAENYRKQFVNDFNNFITSGKEHDELAKFVRDYLVWPRDYIEGSAHVVEIDVKED
jgi:hypothetical protein